MLLAGYPVTPFGKVGTKESLQVRCARPLPCHPEDLAVGGDELAHAMVVGRRELAVRVLFPSRSAENIALDGRIRARCIALNARCRGCRSHCAERLGVR
jgi:hypothetical protein